PAASTRSLHDALPICGPAQLNESFAVIKDTKINERFTHQFRMEMQNPLNRVVFGNPVTNFAAGNFGRITGTAVGPRNLQFGMKVDRKSTRLNSSHQIT